MTERDRVLDAFRNCITEPKCKGCPWTECETIGNSTIEIPRDLALAVMRALVAQEPRVMTLEEACSDIDFCWLEIKDYQAVWVSDCVIMPNGRQVLIERLGCDPVAFKPEDYGKTWRCWENESTDDQRKAVKWDD